MRWRSSRITEFIDHFLAEIGLEFFFLLTDHKRDSTRKIKKKISLSFRLPGVLVIRSTSVHGLNSILLSMPAASLLCLLKQPLGGGC